MRVQAVSPPLVIFLCLASFMLGRFVQQGTNLPEPVQVGWRWGGSWRPGGPRDVGAGAQAMASPCRGTR